MFYRPRHENLLPVAARYALRFGYAFRDIPFRISVWPLVLAFIFTPGCGMARRLTRHAHPFNVSIYYICAICNMFNMGRSGNFATHICFSRISIISCGFTPASVAFSMIASIVSLGNMPVISGFLSSNSLLYPGYLATISDTSTSRMRSPKGVTIRATKPLPMISSTAGLNAKSPSFAGTQSFAVCVTFIRHDLFNFLMASFSVSNADCVKPMHVFDMLLFAGFSAFSWAFSKVCLAFDNLANKPRNST